MRGKKGDRVAISPIPESTVCELRHYTRGHGRKIDTTTQLAVDYIQQSYRLLLSRGGRGGLEGAVENFESVK